MDNAVAADQKIYEHQTAYSSVTSNVKVFLLQWPSLVCRNNKEPVYVAN